MESRVFRFPSGHISHELLEKAASAEAGMAFQREMYACGQELGAMLSDRSPEGFKKVCIVTSALDADGLARGVADFLKAAGIEVKLLCYWSHPEKVYDAGVTVAPILRAFEEPGVDQCGHLVAVQSIAGDIATIKTNITAALQLLTPKSIQVLSPVLHADFRKSLLKQFPESMNCLFDFHDFAEDAELNAETGELKPGLGGLEMARMGLPAGKPYLGFPLSVMELLQA